MATVADVRDDQCNAMQASPFRLIFFPWQTNPARDAAWYARTVATLGAAMTRQEYPATPAEAFIASGQRFLDGETLRLLQLQYGRDRLAAVVEPALRARYSEPDGAPRQAYNDVPTYAYRVFKEPEPDHRYAVGADTSNGGGDACYAYIGDIDSGEQVAVLLSYTWGAAEFGVRLIEAGRAYNYALLAVEVNNMGVATLSEIVRHSSYPNVYRRQNYDPAQHRDGPPAGWRTDESSRAQLFGGLAEDIPACNLVIHDADTYAQLRALAWIRHGERMKVEAPDGVHDDAPIGCGIFNEVRKNALYNAPPMWYSVG